MAGLTWFRFVGAVRDEVCRLSSSDCPMVFDLPDGREVEPAGVSAELVPSKFEVGGVEYDCYKVKVKLEDDYYKVKVKLEDDCYKVKLKEDKE